MTNKVALGFDIGDRRIGVARGDFEVRIASPLPSIMNDRATFTQIADLIKKNSAAIIVIGLPRNSDGAETRQSVISRNFADELVKFTDAKIVFQDESLTSVSAENNLRAHRDFDEKMLRDGTLDSEAAALILQDFLNSGNTKGLE